jgi:signal transduction histidine kinase
VVISVTALAAGLTAVVAVRAPHNAEVSSPGVLAADVFSAFSAFLVAFLALGRLSQSRLVRHAVLGAAATVLAVGTLVLAVLPTLRGDELSDSSPRVVTGLLAAGLFALACWLPPWSVRMPKAIELAVGSAVLVAVLAVIAARLTSVRAIASLPSSGETFGALPDRTLSACQLAAALLFTLAAVGAVRQADREGDVLMAWLAVGAVLAAFSRVDFVLAQSADSIWVLVGMAFRLGFYVLLLGGAVQEIRWYWRRSTDAAVLEERRRIARDLHDGLAQELAFIAAQSRLVLARPPSTDRLRLLAASSERALDEARRAIAALTHPLDEPFDVALTQEVEEVANRFGTAVSLDLEAGIELSATRREALLRIAREAVTNAGRHGAAQHLNVRLVNHDGVTLRVSDDGAGFDLAAAETGGTLGLVSMRERAEALGGTCTVTSAREHGTTVEVRLP